MPFDFPNSPTSGQIATGPNGVTYKWDGTKWVAQPLPDLYATLNSPVFTGDPQAPTAAVGDNDQSLATTQFATRVAAPALNDVGRNLVHNARFNINQRANAPWTTNAYTMDRWVAGASGSTFSITQATVTDAQRAQIGDESATWLLNDVFTGTSGAGDYVLVSQPIEGVRRLSNKTVIVSFYATCAAGTLKVGAALDQIFGTGGSPSATAIGTGQSVTVTTTFARYSMVFNVPSVAGMTLGTNNNDYTSLGFWFSAGANQNAHAGGIGVQSGTIALWGVQLEIAIGGNTQPTPLEKIDPQQDLANCQRFYCTGYLGAGGYGVVGGSLEYAIMYPVTMRGTPAFVVSGGGGGLNPFVQGGNDNRGTIVSWPVATSGNCYWNGSFTASADL